MARKVFFSFHFDRDSWRVSQVRNSFVVDTQYEKPPFLDAVDWEKIKRRGDQAIKQWIDSQLMGTSVTVVLIGAETSLRPWVKYEIEKSWERGNGLIGVYIHNMKNQNGFTDLQGTNPFDKVSVGGNPYNRLSMQVKTYDWVLDLGRINIGSWIEAAARARGR